MQCNVDILNNMHAKFRSRTDKQKIDRYNMWFARDKVQLSKRNVRTFGPLHNNLISAMLSVVVRLPLT